jgi:ABC-2 type transport system ATP-binding protein
MEKTLHSLKKESGITIEPGETSLEDVFIQFMGKSKDNMA